LSAARVAGAGGAPGQRSPHHPEPADAPAGSWSPQPGPTSGAVEVVPAVVMLVVRVSHSGRAPPARSSVPV
jgi:hypothetical protein